MRTVIIFESAKELFDACTKYRGVNDEGVILPAAVTLVIDGERLELQGEGALGFDLSASITSDAIFQEACSRAGLDIHLT